MRGFGKISKEKKKHKCFCQVKKFIHMYILYFWSKITPFRCLKLTNVIFLGKFIFHQELAEMNGQYNKINFQNLLWNLCSHRSTILANSDLTRSRWSITWLLWDHRWSNVRVCQCAKSHKVQNSGHYFGQKTDLISKYL